MSEQNQAPEQDVQEFNNEMTQRRSKLAALREQGNPFPNDFRRDHISSEIHEQFGDKSADELAALNAKVKIAGRIMTRASWVRPLLPPCRTWAARYRSM